MKGRGLSDGKKRNLWNYTFTLWPVCLMHVKERTLTKNPIFFSLQLYLYSLSISLFLYVLFLSSLSLSKRFVPFHGRFHGRKKFHFIIFWTYFMKKGTQQIICNIWYFKYFWEREEEKERAREEERENKRKRRVSEPENVGMRRKACCMKSFVDRITRQNSCEGGKEKEWRRKEEKEENGKKEERKADGNRSQGLFPEIEIPGLFLERKPNLNSCSLSSFVVVKFWYILERMKKNSMRMQSWGCDEKVETYFKIEPIEEILFLWHDIVDGTKRITRKKEEKKQWKKIFNLFSIHTLVSIPFWDEWDRCWGINREENRKREEIELDRESDKRKK